MSYPNASMNSMQCQLIKYDIVVRLKCVDMDADSLIVQSIFDRTAHMLNHVKLQQLFLFRGILQEKKKFN